MCQIRSVGTSERRDFFRLTERFYGQKKSATNSSIQPDVQYLILNLISFTDACSSRSTPKPRPPGAGGGGGGVGGVGGGGGGYRGHHRGRFGGGGGIGGGGRLGGGVAGMHRPNITFQVCREKNMQKYNAS